MNDINSIDSYDYFLPEHLIAQLPHDPVDKCKLMLVNKNTGEIQHSIFNQALLHLTDNDCIFLIILK